MGVDGAGAGNVADVLDFVASVRSLVLFVAHEVEAMLNVNAMRLFSLFRFSFYFSFFVIRL